MGPSAFLRAGTKLVVQSLLHPRSEKLIYVEPDGKHVTLVQQKPARALEQRGTPTRDAPTGTV